MSHIVSSLPDAEFGKSGEERFQFMNRLFKTLIIDVL